MRAPYEHLFVRHVATDKNLDNYNDSIELQEKITSLPDAAIPVNSDGAEQGRLLKQCFAEYLLSVGVTGTITIFHSDYKRAEATLSYILESIERKGPAFSIESIRDDERLRDIDQGLITNVPYEDATHRFPSYAQQIETKGYLDAVPPGGESHREALGRIRTFLSELEHTRHHTITITHFSTLVLIRWILEGLSDQEVLDTLAGTHYPNACVTRYFYYPETHLWRLEELNRAPWELEQK